MTTTRRWTTALALVATAWAPALGAQQTGQTPERGPRGGRGVEAMVERALEHRGALELSEEQVARLEALRSETLQEMEPLRERMRALRESARERREALRERAAEEGADRQALRREAREAMRGPAESMRELAREAGALQRERARAFRETITAEQMLRLRRLTGDARGALGRTRGGEGPRAFRGPGPRGGRGQPGFRGRGFRGRGGPGAGGPLGPRSTPAPDSGPVPPAR